MQIQKSFPNTTRVPHAKLLSPEEQIFFFDKWKAEGKQKDRDVLIMANLALVYKLASPYCNAPMFADLIHEGVLGLMRGLEIFDKTRGMKLSSYLALWAKAKILRFVLNNQTLIKAGPSKAQVKSFWKYDKIKNQLIQDGIDPTDDVMAELFETTVEDLHKLERPQVVFCTEEEFPVLECEHPEHFYLQKENKVNFDAVIKLYMEKLEPRERDIFENHIYKDKEDADTLTKLASKYGITKQRVSQIENDIIKALKIKLKGFKNELRGQRTRDPEVFAKR